MKYKKPKPRRKSYSSGGFSKMKNDLKIDSFKWFREAKKLGRKLRGGG